MEASFNMWNGLLYKYIYSRLRNRELTEDLVQEVFMKAWNCRESFDGKKSSLKNWLFVITTNLLRDFYRKKKINTEEISEEIANDNDTEKEVGVNDLVDFVFKKMQFLSEKEQNLISLRYKADLKIEDIAEIMHMNSSATKVAIHRAIKKLKSFCND